jgi:hypothetical protein
MISSIAATPAVTSLTLSQTYGFAPALIVPGAVTPWVTYAAINPNPDAVPAVTEVARDSRLGNLIDNYA